MSSWILHIHVHVVVYMIIYGRFIPKHLFYLIKHLNIYLFIYFDSLVHMPDLVSYNPNKLGAFPEQVRLSKKEEIMSIQAFNLPSEILDVLSEYSTLERNWVGIASEFTQCMVTPHKRAMSLVLDSASVTSIYCVTLIGPNLR